MSDRWRVLEALRQAGQIGIHSHDIRRAGLTGNPAQRIAELRLEGHTIEGRSEWRNGRNGKRWILQHDAERGGATAERPADPDPSSLGAVGHSSPGDLDSPGRTLFEPPAEAPRNAALEDWDEAA